MISSENMRREAVPRWKVIDVLRMVIDPELGINIVDMGLLYSADIDEKLRKMTVEMTLSSRGCPMTAAIVGAVENILNLHFPEYTIAVELVWKPAWSPECISKAGRQQLEE